MKIFRHIIFFVISTFICAGLGFLAGFLFLPRELAVIQRVPYRLNGVSERVFEEFAAIQFERVKGDYAAAGPDLGDYLSFVAGMSSDTEGYVDIILKCPVNLRALMPFRQMVQKYAQDYRRRNSSNQSPAELTDDLPAMISKTQVSSRQYELAVGGAATGTLLGLAYILLGLARKLKAAAVERKECKAEKPNTAAYENEQQNEPRARDESVMWSPQYDRLADQVEILRRERKCPIVLFSPMSQDDVSPRPAVNLAIALSRRGYSVVVIDVDPQQEQLSNVFDLPNDCGLADYIKDPDNSIAVQQTQLPGLSVMTPGRNGQAHPLSETDEPGKLACWEKLRATFDIAILNHSRVLQGDEQLHGCCEAGQLLKVVDGVFCVTRANNKVRLKRLAKRARVHLEERKVKFMSLAVLRN